MINLGFFNVSQALVDPETGRGSTVFIRWINSVVGKIQDALNGIADALAQAGHAVDTSNSAIGTANTANATANSATVAANAATAAASSATTTVNATKAELSLLESYIAPLASITAVGVAGSPDTASITIGTHTRVYGDGSSVSITGATRTGLATATRYWIWYDDPGHAGGAVSYHLATDPTNAGQSGGHHFVGVITTPASAAAASTTGQSILPARVIA